jgi:4-amino-4-deoxy-L-arabinose transferase-like glycosyltransferase
MDKWFRPLLVLAILVWFTAVRVDTMDIDASQYATISREMLETGSYLQVLEVGRDYLDKPPLLFWVSSLSMKIFGVSNFGYKFPSLLAAILALWGTWVLARRLYNKTIAQLAVLILAACQGMFLMTNDIRTDTLLMGFTITAIAYLYSWIEDKKWWQLLIGFSCIALGMMAKGPVAIIIPALALGVHLIIKRDWKNIFHPAYLLGLLWIGVMLIPMCIGLYQQFDMHPEKEVYGLKGPSGLRFFFWTQSFGRITGEIYWNNGAGITFLLENMLWSFLPWIFIFLWALVMKITDLIRHRAMTGKGYEWITAGGFVLSYLALGSSKYQLPHYIFVVYPLAAIVTAWFIYEVHGQHQLRSQKVVNGILWFVSIALFVAAGLILKFTFQDNWALWAVYLAAGFAAMMGIYRTAPQYKVVLAAVLAITWVNGFLTNHFYTNLLQYQPASVLGRFVHEHELPAKKVYRYKPDQSMNGVHFYAQHTIAGTENLNNIGKGDYLMTTAEGINDITEQQLPYRILTQMQGYRVSALSAEFLNSKTRNEVTTPYFLVEIQ